MQNVKGGNRPATSSSPSITYIIFHSRMTYHRKTSLKSVFSLLTAVAVAALVAMSCSGRKDDASGISAERTAKLRMIDDSVAYRSPRARAMVDSAIAAAKDSVELCDYQLRLARLYIADAKGDSAESLLNEATAYLKRLTPSPHVNGMLGFAYNCEAAWMHNSRRMPKKAIRRYRMAYDKLMESDRKETLPDICANLADAYSFDSDLPSAARWYRRALFLVDSLQLKSARNITLYTGLARVYMMLEDYASAKKYFDASEKRFGQMNIDMQIYHIISMGNYHYYKKEYAEALRQFERLIRLLSDNGMQESYSMYVGKVNIADVLLNMRRLDEAKRYVTEADRYFSAIDDSVAIYYTHSVELGLAMRLGDKLKARQIAKLDDKPQSIEPGLKRIRDKYLREYYEQTGQYGKALENLKKETSENDSLVHNRQHMVAAELMNRFTQDTLQLHHEIEMQHKENDVKEAHTVILGAVALLIVLTLVIACGVIYMRKNRLAEKMRVFRLRLQNARNRISPHFVFNVLNSRITSAPTKEADELLNLSKLIRASLDLTGKEMATVEEEMDFVESYIQVERMTIGDGFEYERFDGEGITREKLSAFLIPSMSVQILVENSIKHALRGKQGRKLLSVSITAADDGGIDISVSDNGSGFDIRRQSPTGQGLDILRTTISILNQRNKRKTSLTIKNIKDENGNTQGCTAMIHFPEGLKGI